MNQWLSESQLVNNISRDLMQPRQEHYSQDAYRMSIEHHPKLRIKHIQPYNRFGQKIYGVIVDLREKQSEYCLIFMHGLGSNILQGSILIDYLGPNMALCCFDFSGSGKSQGSCNSYGTKEYQDIGAIINYLELQGYKKIILWGRSMGAFASLAYTTALTTRSSLTNSSIVMQILDSPFSNFQDVCKNRARNYFNIPEIFVEPAVNLLKKNMSTHQFSPFSLDLCQRAHLCQIHTLFVYNEKDDVIPSQNTQKLIQQLSKSCPYQRLIISDHHSNLRCKQTLSLIFDKIRKFLFRRQVAHQKGSAKRKALNVYSGFLKKGDHFKSEHYKRTSEIVDKFDKKQKRKGALFCSLSKQICNDFNNKGLRLIKLVNPEVREV